MLLIGNGLYAPIAMVRTQLSGEEKLKEIQSAMLVDYISSFITLPAPSQ
ncbi:putative transcription factor elt-4 [Caenorhabditis elegans]|uniref:Isoform b of Probable transcription factor elt-4 n=1 Tax=Caenorhabditis elegans TaxID=6239 RepID=Q8MQA7-2|nr:putative transcription factor elt-4 [Caenorhabditis elegans]CBH29655.2 Probable transcription factor elt-4 [Caenorhabditis elegans]|eukprot:NP_001338795.1 Erythroid-Like Transcription factor family [Caenorhabditis elegans]